MKYRSDAKVHVKKRQISTPEKNDSGFTLIEVLIAITIVSLIGIPVFKVFSETVTFTGKIKELTHWNMELVGLERVLRKSFSKIKIPFWISDIEVSKGISILKVPYWNGEVNSFLEIEVEDEALKIITPDKITIFKGYGGFDFSFLEDSQSRPIGLSLAIKKNKKENLTFHCTFGSVGREVFNEKLRIEN